MTHPDGTTSQTVYDVLGKQIASIDQLGRTTSYTYDDMGRLIHTTYPDNTFLESTYDAEGQRLTSTDRGGRTTRYGYDALGRLVQTTFSDGAVITNSYDDAGRLLATTDALNNTTRYSYDDAGRRTTVTDALNETMAFAYDANGNQISFTDARNNTTQYEYDALNRRIRTIFPDNTHQQTTYDALGRRIAETDQAGLTTQFAYDALGRLMGVTDTLSQTTTYAYDELGNLIRQTDANGHTTTFEYDQLSRQTRRTLPLGASETMSYNVVGNLISHIDFNGTTITYAYDLNDRLTERNYPNGSLVEFTYTATGQRATATDARGTTTYSYDSRDRLISLTYPDGRSLEYDYDAQGNRTSLTAQVGGATLTTDYAYDTLNRLATVTDPAGRDYSYGYDPNGNRDQLAYPNGTVTSYTYNTLNRLTNLTTGHTGGGTIQSYAYTLGPAGNRTQIDELGGTIRAYTYDALYRLTGETVSGDLSYQNTFSYDPVGNRLAQVQMTGTTTTTLDYTYDARDRMLTENASTYTWDDNGNLVTRSGAATYVWDFENQLIRVELVGGTEIEYQYDADGNRVQTRTTLAGGAATVTDYLVDTSGSLSHVVAETDGGGNLNAYYVRGDDLLGVIRGSQTRFYHADGLGSIRKLTDESGNVTDSYTFSAFGELLDHTGSDPNAYLFAGEPLDPNSGFYYNRARWMDPQVGRFVGIDRHPGVASDPPTLHKYLYTVQDPVNKIDPSGLFLTMPEMSNILTSLTTLAAVALPRFHAILSFVSLNYFTIQRTIEYVEFGTTAIGATFAAADILERMATNLITSNTSYPAGPGPRGLQAGRIAGQNLGDNFPTIDHFEDGVAISIKTTVVVEDQGKLLQNIGNWAAELDAVDTVLPGRNAAGKSTLVRVSDIRKKGLLVAIPHEPVPWNAAAFYSQVRKIAQLYKTSIRIVPVRGLRGP
jgi:RHS repeat-associated protein